MPMLRREDEQGTSVSCALCLLRQGDSPSRRFLPCTSATEAAAAAGARSKPGRLKDGHVAAALWTGDLFAADLSGSASDEPTLWRAGEYIPRWGGFGRTLILTGKGVARRAAPVRPRRCLRAGCPTAAAQVAFGSKHGRFTLRPGLSPCMGEGQLGHGNTATVPSRDWWTLASRPVAQVACGKSLLLALTAEGDVYSWGASDEGSSVQAAQRRRSCPGTCRRFRGRR